MKSKYVDILEEIKHTPKNFIIGVDEVGYGAGAGPLFVCAFAAEIGWDHKDLNDSKKLSPKKRERIAKELSFNKYAISCSGPEDIDESGLAVMLRRCYVEAVGRITYHENISINDCLVVIDGTQKVKGLDHLSLPKADSLIPQVMAASVIAKVARDTMMTGLASIVPNYGWDKNFGYLTPGHIAAIKKHGLSPMHRKSYKIKGINYE